MTELAQICEREGWYTGDYSEISDNFFDNSVLNFTDEHKEQIVCLQRIFAFCVETQTMPEIKDLNYNNLPKFIHTIPCERSATGGCLLMRYEIRQKLKPASPITGIQLSAPAERKLYSLPWIRPKRSW